MKDYACIVLDSSTQSMEGVYNYEKLSKICCFTDPFWKYSTKPYAHQDGKPWLCLTLLCEWKHCINETYYCNLVGRPQSSEKPYLDAEPLISACMPLTHWRIALNTNAGRSVPFNSACQHLFPLHLNNIGHYNFSELFWCARGCVNLVHATQDY